MPYTELAQNRLIKYFPDDFEIDLNGRTLPWEAAILIPFVDEDVFLGAEQEIIEDSSL
jgi:5'-3' exonuclease